MRYITTLTHIYVRTGIILRFWFPTPTLPRWEREFMKSADYARSQYIFRYISDKLIRLFCNASWVSASHPIEYLTY
jgi:hypothetical protein